MRSDLQLIMWHGLNINEEIDRGSDSSSSTIVESFSTTSGEVELQGQQETMGAKVGMLAKHSPDMPHDLTDNENAQDSFQEAEFFSMSWKQRSNSCAVWPDVYEVWLQSVCSGDGLFARLCQSLTQYRRVTGLETLGCKPGTYVEICCNCWAEIIRNVSYMLRCHMRPMCSKFKNRGWQRWKDRLGPKFMNFEATVVMYEQVACNWANKCINANIWCMSRLVDHTVDCCVYDPGKIDKIRRFEEMVLAERALDWDGNKVAQLEAEDPQHPYVVWNLLMKSLKMDPKSNGFYDRLKWAYSPPILWRIPNSVPEQLQLGNQQDH